jgi:predicted transcriptional regulator
MKKPMMWQSELKVMEILWREGDTTAKELAIKLNETAGWSKTTTYTVIKKCVDKGLVKRLGTNFTCRALITKDKAREREVEILKDKMFNGSSDLLLASLLGNSKMNAEQIDKLKTMVAKFSAKQ